MHHVSVKCFLASLYLHPLDWHYKCVVTFKHAGVLRLGMQSPRFRGQNAACVWSVFSLNYRTLYTQQDYYGRRIPRRCGTLLHSYSTSTYTEVTTVLLLWTWSSSNATLEYPHRYSNRIAVWVLHGNSRITSQEQHGYFSIGASTVTV